MCVSGLHVERITCLHFPVCKIVQAQSEWMESTCEQKVFRIYSFFLLYLGLDFDNPKDGFELNFCVIALAMFLGPVER